MTTRNSSRHDCPAPWCGRKVDNHLFACRNDWYALPRDVRDGIWDTVGMSIAEPARQEAVAAAVTWYAAEQQAREATAHGPNPGSRT